MPPFAAFGRKRRVRKPRPQRVRHDFLDEIDDWWVVAFPEAKEK